MNERQSQNSQPRHMQVEIYRIRDRIPSTTKSNTIYNLNERTTSDSHGEVVLNPWRDGSSKLILRQHFSIKILEVQAHLQEHNQILIYSYSRIILAQISLML
jgi:hypothetical protein